MEQMHYLKISALHVPGQGIHDIPLVIENRQFLEVQNIVSLAL
jgi:hypothetical protein